MLYNIWRVCERMQIKPPQLKNVRNWDQLSVKEQAELIAYEQIRDYEEMEAVAASAGVKI